MSLTRCLANSSPFLLVYVYSLLPLSTLGWAVTRHCSLYLLFLPRLYMSIVFLGAPSYFFFANAYFLLYIYICFGLTYPGWVDWENIHGWRNGFTQKCQKQLAFLPINSSFHYLHDFHLSSFL